MKKQQVICHSIFTLVILIALWPIANNAYASDTATIDAGIIAGEDWKMEGVSLTVIELNQKKPRFKLSATKLTLPKPFNDLALAKINCDDFTWGHDEVHCNQGKSSVRSAYWQSPTTSFSFHLSPKKNTFKLEDAYLVGSHLSLDAEVIGKNWQYKVNAKHITKNMIDKLIEIKALNLKPVQSTLAQVKQGNLNINGIISGHEHTVQQFNLNIEIEQLNGQTGEGEIAADNLNFAVHLEGKNLKDSEWDWHGEAKIMGGALYVDPVYLETRTQPIVLSARGLWSNNSQKADIQLFTYQHPDAGLLSGSATVHYRDGIQVNKANLSLKSDTLQGLLTTYINPFFSETLFTGVTVAGSMDANFSIIQQVLSDLSINFGKLNINDVAGRMAIKEGTGFFNWAVEPTEIKQSELAWQQLSIKGLPFEKAKMKFTSQANHFNLAQKVTLPILGGSIAVDKFSWHSKNQAEPDVIFAGSLNNMSMEQLSNTMGWMPLLGTISGQIPDVKYQNKTLSLGGEVKINVFDGIVKVNNLASSGLFSHFPRLYSDIELIGLDLDQITERIEFGTITGRLSGFINDLALENWKPVRFIAWFETPEDDDLAHTISQEAVKNIASIGGGGASNLFSGTFLRVFKTFRYDRIGLGCYLHKGVCQMMGMDPKGETYFLIKGGGLPRIDVLGYNPRVSWDVLVERLGRLSSSNNMIVE